MLRIQLKRWSIKRPPLHTRKSVIQVRGSLFLGLRSLTGFPKVVDLHSAHGVNVKFGDMCLGDCEGLRN